MATVHKRAVKNSWIHKGCGGEVMRESVRKGFSVTRRGDSAVASVYENVSGYKCSNCGPVPKSEVGRGKVETETWESTDDFEPLLF
jgi:hypothetical protein